MQVCIALFNYVYQRGVVSSNGHFRVGLFVKKKTKPNISINIETNIKLWIIMIRKVLKDLGVGLAVAFAAAPVQGKSLQEMPNLPKQLQRSACSD